MANHLPALSLGYQSVHLYNKKIKHKWLRHHHRHIRESEIQKGHSSPHRHYYQTSKTKTTHKCPSQTPNSYPPTRTTPQKTTQPTTAIDTRVLQTHDPLPLIKQLVRTTIKVKSENCMVVTLISRHLTPIYRGDMVRG